MRILIHGMNFSPEFVGIGKYTGEMAEWLATRGHEVRVVTAPPYYPQWHVSPDYRAWKYTREQRHLRNGFRQARGAEPTTPGSLEVIRCPLWVPRSPLGLKRLLHLASFGVSSWPAMLRQVAWRPQLVLSVVPTMFGSLHALLVARLVGAKAWLHIQDFEVDAAFQLGDLQSSGARGLALVLERWLLRRFDRVSAISEQMVDRLRMKGVDPSRCVLFPNWVDTNSIFPLSGPSPIRRELSIEEHTLVALYSGNMGKKQGLEILVDVARKMSDHPELLFVFCGDGSYRQRLEELAEGVRNVVFLPLQPVERLNDLLNLADIHLLPQRADAAELVMPSKLTGMFASGRPVVATAHPGTQLATAVHCRGLVTPPGNADAFAVAILQLVKNADLRQRLGEEARKYALTHLDFGGLLRRFEQAMLAACGRADNVPDNNPIHAPETDILPRGSNASLAGSNCNPSASELRKP